MRKQYEEYAYFDDHRGTHVGDGVYKVDEPYISKMLNVFAKPKYKSFALLYKWIDYDASIVEIWYFREGCYGKFKERKESMLNKSNDSDLHYFEARIENEIGGVW